jgi:Flp pilus assembly protein TadD
MTSPHLPQLTALVDAAAGAIDAGDDARAEPLLLRIVAENPRDAEAWHMLAVIAVRAGRGAQAIDLAGRALKLDRRNAIYLNTLGIAHGEAQRLEEALRYFKRALKERPDYAEGHYNLGKAYRKLGNASEAERCYLRARRLDPAKAEVANNLATLYSGQGRYEDALALLAEARVRLPNDEGVAINTATALLARSGPEASIAELVSFLETHPLAAAVHAELGRRLLAGGRFAQGWREYGWRHGRAPADFPQYAGKRILLLPDQGLGDHLFFLRFAPALRERAAHVAFACPEKLFNLLEANSPVSELCRGADAPASFDLSLPVGDLPRLLETSGTPAPLSISAAPRRLSQWRERLAALGPPPYLGVTWRGGTIRIDPSEFAARGEDPLYKAVDIPALASCVRAWRGTVLTLQRHPQENEHAEFCRALGRAAHDLSAANDDLVEMCALLSLVDEYAGVSNTNMHLRAGVGKTGHVLVPFPAEFRWMEAGDQTPWFPGFHVYRQPPSGDWRLALDRLRFRISI